MRPLANAWLLLTLTVILSAIFVGTAIYCIALHNWTMLAIILIISIFYRHYPGLIQESWQAIRYHRMIKKRTRTLNP